jgi:CxxC-x17-CxxC domain-containing protein
MSFEDKTLTCADCNQEFVFTAEEQEQFQTRGYVNDPKRCTECRATRKRNSANSSGSSFGQRREMFPAVCAQCGKDTEVPFQPRGDRPVYCSDCYRAVRPSR